MPKEYRNFKPTAFDHHYNIENRENWLLVPVSQNRDSDTLEKCNFESALKILGGESETVEVHRFGHWGPGWFEIILVDPSRLNDVEEIESALESYPVLDEEAYSEAEFEAERESFDSWIESDLYRTLPDSLQDYLDGLSSDETPNTWSIYQAAKDQTNTYWECDSINIKRIATTYCELLKAELNIKECPNCEGYQEIEIYSPTHGNEWHKCPDCDGTGYIKEEIGNDEEQLKLAIGE